MKGWSKVLERGARKDCCLKKNEDMGTWMTLNLPQLERRDLIGRKGESLDGRG